MEGTLAAGSTTNPPSSNTACLARGWRQGAGLLGAERLEAGSVLGLEVGGAGQQHVASLNQAQRLQQPTLAAALAVLADVGRRGRRPRGLQQRPPPEEGGAVPRQAHRLARGVQLRRRRGHRAVRRRVGRVGRRARFGARRGARGRRSTLGAKMPSKPCAAIASLKNSKRLTSWRQTTCASAAKISASSSGAR